jgi:hypothetical protein
MTRTLHWKEGLRFIAGPRLLFIVRLFIVTALSVLSERVLTEDAYYSIEDPNSCGLYLDQSSIPGKKSGNRQ